MIRNYLRNSQLAQRASLIFLLCLAGGTLHAQTLPDSLPPASGPTYQHALRLDLGGILARNLASNALGNSGTMLPLLVGYEKQVRPRLSGSAELLVNGGSPEERAWGLGVQGRYYYYQGRKTGLVGLYVAPTLGFRGIRQQSYQRFDVIRRKLVGAGVLAGAQLPLGAQGRFLLDVSGGVMAWGRIVPDDTRSHRSSNYKEGTYYENGSVFDGRISLGYRF